MNESRRYVKRNETYLHAHKCFEKTRLWSKLTQAINSKNMEAATEAKTAVEDAQREMRRKMEESGEKYTPRFFQLNNGRWEPKLKSVKTGNIDFSVLKYIFAVYQLIRQRL